MGIFRKRTLAIVAILTVALLGFSSPVFAVPGGSMADILSDDPPTTVNTGGSGTGDDTTIDTGGSGTGDDGPGNPGGPGHPGGPPDIDMLLDAIEHYVRPAQELAVASFVPASTRPPVLFPSVAVGDYPIGLPPTEDQGDVSTGTVTTPLDVFVGLAILEARPDYEYHSPTRRFKSNGNYVSGQKGLGMGPGLSQASPRYVPIGEF